MVPSSIWAPRSASIWRWSSQPMRASRSAGTFTRSACSPSPAGDSNTRTTNEATRPSRTFTWSARRTKSR